MEAMTHFSNQLGRPNTKEANNMDPLIDMDPLIVGVAPIYIMPINSFGLQLKKYNKDVTLRNYNNSLRVLFCISLVNNNIIY